MINGKDIIAIGFSQGPLVADLKDAVEQMVNSGMRDKDVKLVLSGLKSSPSDFTDHQFLSAVAQKILDAKQQNADLNQMAQNTAVKPYKIWGKEGIEEGALGQMQTAMTIPVAVRGALMPDAHLGYSCPIGAVIGLDNAVVPNFVGVDIACRMKLSVIDIPRGYMAGAVDSMKQAILYETRFGVGASFEKQDRRDHDVMNDEAWFETQHLTQLRDTAWKQLGTSGSGNHFVEWGWLEVTEEFDGLAPGEYIALLSHSGSRGAGAKTAQKYHKIATDKMPGRLLAFKNLAWLDMDTEEGEEYWRAMNLMGRYASANHELIHKYVAKRIGGKIIGGVENYHNFAWKEIYEGKELVVHRKGATPAGQDVLGVIPGNMMDAAFVVRGKGDTESMNSASHGAGRAMSRRDAKEKFTWSEWRKKLAAAGVELMSAGLDEVPGAYKSIFEVMAAQQDLVRVIAKFKPKIVRMSDDGKSED